MKPWIILIVLAVTITAVVTVAVPLLSTEGSIHGPEFPAPLKPDGPPPKLVIDQPLEFDFGVMGQQEKRSREWTFKNEGAGVLEVRGSSVTCSCTTSDLFEGPALKTGKLIQIQPGESKQITVNWDTKNWTDYRQAVTVGTNDPDRPTLDLVIKGKIKPAIVTNPADSSIGFMNVSNEEPVLRRILISSPDRPQTKITGVVVTNPALLAVEVKDLNDEEDKKFKVEKGHWIEITLKPSPNLGDFIEEVTVETDHPRRATHTIKVRGKITGPISVIPEKVEMRDATAQDGGTELLTIVARGRTSVNFVVDRKPVGLDVTIAPLAATPGMKGSKYQMTVKLAAGFQPGAIDGEIVIKTDDPKVNEIHVPVAILVKGTI